MSRLDYSSQWKIDQLVATGTVNVGTGNSTIISFAGLNIPDIPLFEVHFSPAGSSRWFREGGYSTNDSTFSRFWARVQNQSILVNTPTGGSVRYYIWSDRVNY